MSCNYRNKSSCWANRTSLLLPFSVDWRLWSRGSNVVDGWAEDSATADLILAWRCGLLLPAPEGGGRSRSPPGEISIWPLGFEVGWRVRVTLQGFGGRRVGHVTYLEMEPRDRQQSGRGPVSQHSRGDNGFLVVHSDRPNKYNCMCVCVPF